MLTSVGTARLDTLGTATVSTELPVDSGVDRPHADNATTLVIDAHRL